MDRLGGWSLPARTDWPTSGAAPVSWRGLVARCGPDARAATFSGTPLVPVLSGTGPPARHVASSARRTSSRQRLTVVTSRPGFRAKGRIPVSAAAEPQPSTGPSGNPEFPVRAPASDYHSAGVARREHSICKSPSRIRVHAAPQHRRAHQEPATNPRTDRSGPIGANRCSGGHRIRCTATSGRHRSGPVLPRFAYAQIGPANCPPFAPTLSEGRMTHRSGVREDSGKWWAILDSNQ